MARFPLPILGSSGLAARHMSLAGETSGFPEAQVGVLPPQVLRHLVWSTVSNSVALAAPSNDRSEVLDSCDERFARGETRPPLLNVLLQGRQGRIASE
jgi:hypothetical protein